MKIKLISSVLLLGVLFWVGCKGSQKANQSAATPKQNLPVHKIVGISQGACFGRCPVYDMTLYSDSTLRLEGKNFINYMGFYAKKIDAAEYNSLMEMVKNVQIDSLKDRYDSGIADLPQVTYFFFDGTNSLLKKVVSQGVELPTLNPIADAMRMQLSKLGWEKDQHAENVNPDEIIIQLQSNATIEQIIEEHWRYKIFVKDTLSKGTGIYLIGFDKTTIDQQRLMQVLKGDKNVKFVETNKKLELRN